MSLLVLCAISPSLPPGSSFLRLFNLRKTLRSASRFSGSLGVAALRASAPLHNVLSWACFTELYFYLENESSVTTSYNLFAKDLPDRCQ